VKTAELQKPGMTVREAARSLAVSERLVYLARKVLRCGVPELEELVSADAVSVSDAAAIVHQTHERQREAIAAVQTGQAKTLQAALGIRQPGSHRRLLKAWNAATAQERDEFVQAAGLQEVPDEHHESVC
jgi:hypothetical protein